MHDGSWLLLAPLTSLFFKKQNYVSFALAMHKDNEAILALTFQISAIWNMKYETISN